MEKTKIAIVGLGTVGSGVARLLLDFGDRTARHAGRTLWLEKVVVRDLKKKRDCELPEGVLTDDLHEVLNDPEIKVVAQLIGGVEVARTTMIQLLEAGKDVVTANKALLAEHGAEMVDLATKLGRSIAFEAAVAGGIPIVANLTQCLSANQTESIQGILNGTSNFILSKMVDEGGQYAEVLKEAQELGFAEADPTMDVDGTDAAQKLSILAQIAFGARVHWSQIPRKGIDTLDLADVSYAREMGYQIKLLAVARLCEAGLELHVSPTLIRKGTPLAEVRGAYNAIQVIGDAVGEVFYHGLGAGQMPTASAVVADLIDTAVGRTALTFQHTELCSASKTRVEAIDPDFATGRFYLRFEVADSPGMMAQVATILGEHGISISSVLQHEAGGNGTMIPLVFMTHQTTEGATRKACKKLDQMGCVRPGTVRMWVRD